MIGIGIFLGLTTLAISGASKKKGDKAAKVAQQLLEQYRGLKETDPEMKQFLFTIWKNLGLSDKEAERYIKERIAWSAALISYVMIKGGYSDFPISASHSCYNERARKNREQNTGKFHLYRINEYKPKVGDIVSKGRAGVTLTYDSVKCGLVSHSDIVVAVTPTELITIGGNVGDAISITKVPLKNGYIDKPGYYAIIKNIHG
jgi:hypothetical protein